jgi:hypothetical protein
MRETEVGSYFVLVRLRDHGKLLTLIMRETEVGSYSVLVRLRGHGKLLTLIMRETEVGRVTYGYAVLGLGRAR